MSYRNLAGRFDSCHPNYKKRPCDEGERPDSVAKNCANQQTSGLTIGGSERGEKQASPLNTLEAGACGYNEETTLLLQGKHAFKKTLSCTGESTYIEEFAFRNIRLEGIKRAGVRVTHRE
jgi:hypothetical protein